MLFLQEKNRNCFNICEKTSYRKVANIGNERRLEKNIIFITVTTAIDSR